MTWIIQMGSETVVLREGDFILEDKIIWFVQEIHSHHNLAVQRVANHEKGRSVCVTYVTIEIMFLNNKLRKLEPLEKALYDL